MSAPNRYDKFFIDTNIFIYCFDDRQPDKKVRAILYSEDLNPGHQIDGLKVVDPFR